MTEIVLNRDYYHRQREIDHWCCEQFGALQLRTGEERWGVNRHFGYSHFYFKYKEDATLFSLKWL